MTIVSDDVGLRRAIRWVALLNLAWFFVEFGVARRIGSVSLFADSVDFLEDASVNLLILMALRWSAKARARMGMVLAAILLVPGLATVWTGANKILTMAPPEAVLLTLTGLGALTINLGCAFMLAQHRHAHGSMTRAAFLSARNDALANVAIITAGLITSLLWHSIWPDLIVGLGIAIMNMDAAREVWVAAREEHRAAHP